MARRQLSNLDFENTARIENLPDGTDPQHPATVAQLNAAIEGVSWKDAARVSTQGNVNLASPGASLDGVSLSNGDRVLVRAQTDDTENGIYVWGGAATPMVRAADDTRLIVRMYDLSELFTVAPAYVAGLSEPGDPEHSYFGLMVFDYRTFMSALGGDASAFDGFDVTNLQEGDAEYR